MSNTDYLNGIVEKYERNFSYSQNEESAYNTLKDYLSNWFSSEMRAKGYYDVSLEIQRSGSRAKGTAIKGKSDIDIFLSISDPENRNTLEEYFDLVLTRLKTENLSARKQNVSIGIKYKECDIDIVPAKKVNSQSYLRYNDHYLWSTKTGKRTLTNIQKHIDTVKNSDFKKEIMLTKIWRENHNLDFPSVYIELVVLEALNGKKQYNLGKDFLTVLKYLQDVFYNKKIVDPANCNNIVSEILNNAEKQKIVNQAQIAVKAQYWSGVVK